MKKTLVMAMVALVGLTAFARHGSNHRLAGDIALGLGLALGGCNTTYVAPAPVVVGNPTVISTVSTYPAGYTYTTTVPTTYSYSYYNGVYCPTYGGYYFYNDAWVWGGGFGVRPPLPTWRPLPYRPVHRPPPPPIHHGGFRGGPAPRGGFGGPRGGMPHGGHHGGHRR